MGGTARTIGIETNGELCDFLIMLSLIDFVSATARSCREHTIEEYRRCFLNRRVQSVQNRLAGWRDKEKYGPLHVRGSQIYAI